MYYLIGIAIFLVMITVIHLATRRIVVVPIMAEYAARKDPRISAIKLGSEYSGHNFTITWAAYEGKYSLVLYKRNCAARKLTEVEAAEMMDRNPIKG